jgi:hypothetical protein
MTEAVDSYGLDAMFDVYSRNNIVAVCISFLFVFLFFITQALDLNKVLIDFGVSDTVVTKAKFLYVYTVGYVIFILKFIISLVTFVLLIAIIVIIIVSLISVLKVKDPSAKSAGNFTGAKQQLDQIEGSILKDLKEGVLTVGRYILSFIAVKQYLLVYVVVIPIFLFFYYLFYITILYNPKKIEEDENKPNVMNTNHMYIFFLFVSLCLMAFVYLCYIYAIEIHD